MNYREGHLQSIWTGVEWRVEAYYAGRGWIVTGEQLDPCLQAARHLIDCVVDLGVDLRIERKAAGTVMLTERLTTAGGTEVIKMGLINGVVKRRQANE